MGDFDLCEIDDCDMLMFESNINWSDRSITTRKCVPFALTLATNCIKWNNIEDHIHWIHRMNNRIFGKNRESISRSDQIKNLQTHGTVDVPVNKIIYVGQP